MSKNPVDTLHAAMTNQYVILVVAIVLFLLVIILKDPSSENIGVRWV
jgi:hypothetical protein